MLQYVFQQRHLSSLSSLQPVSTDAPIPNRSNDSQLLGSGYSTEDQDTHSLASTTTDICQFSTHHTSTYTCTEALNYNDIPTVTVSEATEAAILTELSNVQPVSTDVPTPTSIVLGRTRRRHSPASSPHKLGKRGPKRRRIVSVWKLVACKRNKPIFTKSISFHRE